MGRETGVTDFADLGYIAQLVVPVLIFEGLEELVCPIVLSGSGAKFSVADAPGPPDGLAAASLVPAPLKPRFTYPRAISLPIVSLRVALVIQPTSFPGAEGGTSFIPG